MSTVGTSPPELVSSVVAMRRGAPEMVPGKPVGSDAANLLLVVSVAVVVGGIPVKCQLARVDLSFPAASGFLLILTLRAGTVTPAERAIPRVWHSNLCRRRSMP